MTAITFDTLAYANKLKKAGASNELAEATAEATIEVFNNLVQDQIATKKDINDLKIEIHNLRNELKDLLNNNMWKIVGLLGVLQGIFHFIK